MNLNQRCIGLSIDHRRYRDRHISIVERSKEKRRSTKENGIKGFTLVEGREDFAPVSEKYTVSQLKNENIFRKQKISYHVSEETSHGTVTFCRHERKLGQTH